MSVKDQMFHDATALQMAMSSSSPEKDMDSAYSALYSSVERSPIAPPLDLSRPQPQHSVVTFYPSSTASVEPTTPVSRSWRTQRFSPYENQSSHRAITHAYDRSTYGKYDIRRLRSQHLSKSGPLSYMDDNHSSPPHSAMDFEYGSCQLFPKTLAAASTDHSDPTHSPMDFEYRSRQLFPKTLAAASTGGVPYAQSSSFSPSSPMDNSHDELPSIFAGSATFSSPNSGVLIGSTAALPTTPPGQVDCYPSTTSSTMSSSHTSGYFPKATGTSSHDSNFSAGNLTSDHDSPCTTLRNRTSLNVPSINNCVPPAWPTSTGHYDTNKYKSRGSSTEPSESHSTIANCSSSNDGGNNIIHSPLGRYDAFNTSAAEWSLGLAMQSPPNTRAYSEEGYGPITPVASPSNHSNAQKDNPQADSATSDAAVNKRTSLNGIPIGCTEGVLDSTAIDAQDFDAFCDNAVDLVALCADPFDDCYGSD